MGNSSSQPAAAPTPTAAPPYPSLPAPSYATMGVDANSSADAVYNYWNAADVPIDDSRAPNGMPAWPTDQRLLRYVNKATVTRRPVYGDMKRAYDEAIAGLKALAADQDAWWLEHNTVHQANLQALYDVRDGQLADADADARRMADELIAAADDYKAQLDDYAERIAANARAEADAGAAHGVAAATTDVELCARMRAIRADVDRFNGKTAGLVGRGFLDGQGLRPPTVGAPASCAV